MHLQASKQKHSGFRNCRPPASYIDSQLFCRDSFQIETFFRCIQLQSAGALLSALQNTNVEKARSLLRCSEWILWGNGVLTVTRLPFSSNSFTKTSLLLGPTGPHIIHRPHTGRRSTDLRSVTSPLPLLHPGSESFIWMKFQKLSRAACIISHKSGLIQFWKSEQCSKS